MDTVSCRLRPSLHALPRKRVDAVKEHCKTDPRKLIRMLAIQDRFRAMSSLGKIPMKARSSTMPNDVSEEASGLVLPRIGLKPT